MSFKFLNLTNLTLLVALSISTVAAYYSIIGLTAIFAGAFIPVIIMGSILEVGKITATVWLRKYWHQCGLLLKLYLVPAVVALALITSMGIFGFLSKAHMETGLVSGDVQSQLLLIDEKIKTSKDNIEANRKALKQLDEAVDQIMSRSSTEAGADKAVQVRRAQARDRARLLAEIQAEQKTIAKLNEEAAPIRAEFRKVEAEVGPIKYIAAMIYGDNPDNNLLEAAVRWVIILLVIVFDPLAIILVLAANSSREWDKQQNKEQPLIDQTDQTDAEEKPKTEEKTQEVKSYEPDDGPLTQDQLQQIKETVENKSMLEQYPYLTTKTDYFGDIKPIVYKPNKIDEPVEKQENKSVSKKTKVKKPTPMITSVKPKKKKKTIDTEKKTSEIANLTVESIERPGDYLLPDDTNAIVQPKKPYKELESGYILFEGKQMTLESLKESRPDLFKLNSEASRSVNSSFGISFPVTGDRGDLFVKVDTFPNRVYKYDGIRWIEIDKSKTDTYLFNDKYIQYLIEKIENREYDIDLITDAEKDQIQEYLKSTKHR